MPCTKDELESAGIFGVEYLQCLDPLVKRFTFFPVEGSRKGDMVLKIFSVEEREEMMRGINIDNWSYFEAKAFLNPGSDMDYVRHVDEARRRLNDEEFRVAKLQGIGIAKKVLRGGMDSNWALEVEAWKSRFGEEV